MDQEAKDILIDRFRAYLDALEPEDGSDPEQEVAGEASDIYSVFVELAGLRTEVRTESRLVKEALDQFRSVFERLDADHGALVRELDRSRAEEKERGRSLLRPLLLDLLDLRDRLAVAAATQSPPPRRAWPFGRSDRTMEVWREGLVMTLSRLDRLLFDRQVEMIEVLDRPFDPHHAQAVSIIADSARAHGLVVEEVRAGFRWQGDLLRPAEVVVNRISAEQGEGP